MGRGDRRGRGVGAVREIEGWGWGRFLLFLAPRWEKGREKVSCLRLERSQVRGCVSHSRCVSPHVTPPMRSSTNVTLPACFSTCHIPFVFPTNVTLSHLCSPHVTCVPHMSHSPICVLPHATLSHLCFPTRCAAPASDWREVAGSRETQCVRHLASAVGAPSHQTLPSDSLISPL